jgi:3-phenylpropionate/cinnamic acid dioxygenase small subunit
VSRPTIADDELLLLHRCTEFVLAEAELLDQRALEEWTGLFTEDAVYWLPMDPAQAAPGDGLNIIYDDKPRLLDRVSRLQSGLAFSDEPHSLTSHVLSAIRVLRGEQASAVTGTRPLATSDHVAVARGVIGRARQGRVDTFHARISWVLRESGHEPGDELRIAMKRIDLLNARDPLPVLTFLL